jgi:hypothetical protein
MFAKTRVICNETCPDCKHPMVARHSIYGYFWGCSQYPKCKGIRKVKDIDICPKCGSKLIEDVDNKVKMITRYKVCKSKKCDFKQQISVYHYYEHNTYRDYNPHGWSDAEHQEYADYCGIDSSVCWGGD